jgi:magnesium chelatase family protein
VPGPRLRELWPLPRESALMLDKKTFAGNITRRGATRVHRVAWTLADLAGAPGPTPADVETALRLRTGDPLDSAVLRRAG